MCVTAAMVTLGAKPGWRQRLPAGLPELSEALLLAAGEYPFTDRALRFSRRPLAVGLASLGEIGLGREDVYIANVVKCRPPKNRDPRPDEG